MTEPWKCPPVHPAAEKLPMMSDVEIDVQAADIKRNCMIEPIVIWVDNSEAANGSEGPFPEWLLDGRNRLAALKRLGITDPRKAPLPVYRDHDGIKKLHALQKILPFGGDFRWVTETDPELYVLSVNVHRRHLTPEQKRDAIVRYIKADPKASDLKVAKTLKVVSDKTVAKVRKETFKVRKLRRMNTCRSSGLERLLAKIPRRASRRFRRLQRSAAEPRKGRSRQPTLRHRPRSLQR